MSRQLWPVLLAAFGCTPDTFEYGGGSAAGCHSDGCPTACPIGSVLGPDGSCVVECGAWQASLEMPAPGGLIATGDEVFAVGTSAPEDGRPAQGMVQLTETCRGDLTKALLPLSSQGSSLSAIAATPSVVTTAGASDGVVTLAELDPETGAPQSTQAVPSLPADAVVVDLSVSEAGAWAVGTSKTSGAWFAHASGGKLCSASLTGITQASAVAAQKGSALVVAEVAGKLRLLRVDAGGCATPSFASADVALPGADSARARDLLVIESAAYVVGNARLGAGEPFAFVAQLDSTSGQLVTLASWDPGPGADAFFAVAGVGAQLFAGGVSGAPDPEGEGGGSAVVTAWALPLGAEAKPAWTEQTKARRIHALAENGASVFALSATSSGISTLSRLSIPDG